MKFIEARLPEGAKPTNLENKSKYNLFFTQCLLHKNIKT